MRRSIYVMFFLATISLLTGCLSGPLPEDIAKTTAPPTAPPLPLTDLTFVSFDTISYTPVSEFTHLIPRLNGLEFLPHLSSVDVLTNDLSVLEYPSRLQILASIAGKQSGIYLIPQQDTDILVYYTVYKLNDTATAEDVLSAYKGAWNKRLLNISGAEIWIWDGYLDEMAGTAQHLGQDSILYWDPQGQTSFLSSDVRTDYPALSKTDTALFSVHGETAYENYFIMIDIKAELNDIQLKTDSMFTQVATQIFKVTPTSNPPENEEQPGDNGVDDSSDTEEKLRQLLESYLAGNITKEEYDSTFEDLVEN